MSFYRIKVLTFEEVEEGEGMNGVESEQVVAVLDANQVRHAPNEKWYITALVRMN